MQPAKSEPAATAIRNNGAIRNRHKRILMLHGGDKALFCSTGPMCGPPVQARDDGFAERIGQSRGHPGSSMNGRLLCPWRNRWFVAKTRHRCRLDVVDACRRVIQRAPCANAAAGRRIVSDGEQQSGDGEGSVPGDAASGLIPEAASGNT